MGYITPVLIKYKRSFLPAFVQNQALSKNLKWRNVCFLFERVRSGRAGDRARPRMYAENAASRPLPFF
jgi:hypothetical protein